MGRYDSEKKTALHDRLYASMQMSTDGFSSETHRLTVGYNESEEHCVGPQLNLHFDGVYLSLSVADWRRVAAAVDSVIPAAVCEI